MDEMTLGKARLDQWFFSISSVQHFDDDLIHNCNLEWQSLIKEYLLSFALITDYEIDEFEFIVIFKRMFLFSREKLNDNALKSQCYGFKFSVIVSFEFE